MFVRLAILATLALAAEAKYSKIVSFPTKADAKYEKALQARPAIKGEYLCEGCVRFAEDGIGALLKAIAGGIPATCGALCGIAFGGSAAGEVCDLLCDVAGLDGFVHLLGTADISPLWFCMELRACPISTCNKDCVQFSGFAATPASAGPPAKITFGYAMEFSAGVGTVTSLVSMNAGKNGWASDGLVLLIAPPPGAPVQESMPSHLELQDNMGDTECPAPGVYASQATVCYGLCGDKFRISGPIMAQSAPINVTVTAGNGCQPQKQPMQQEVRVVQ